MSSRFAPGCQWGKITSSWTTLSNMPWVHTHTHTQELCMLSWGPVHSPLYNCAYVLKGALWTFWNECTLGELTWTLMEFSKLKGVVLYVMKAFNICGKLCVYVRVRHLKQPLHPGGKESWHYSKEKHRHTSFPLMLLYLWEWQMYCVLCWHCFSLSVG